jgi:hypothetical protein
LNRSNRRRPCLRVGAGNAATDSVVVLPRRRSRPDRCGCRLWSIFDYRTLMGDIVWLIIIGVTAVVRITIIGVTRGVIRPCRSAPPPGSPVIPVTPMVSVAVIPIAAVIPVASAVSIAAVIPVASMVSVTAAVPRAAGICWRCKQHKRSGHNNDQ